MKKASPRQGPTSRAAGVCAIAVEGFKSLRRRTEIAIRPLTLLAGANSSGKSSVLQAPLLLKQTLETPYDPGAILLDGPHVRFTATDQVLSRSGGKRLTDTFTVQIEMSDGGQVAVRFKQQPRMGFEIAEMSAALAGQPVITVRPEMSHRVLYDRLPARIRGLDGKTLFQRFSVHRDRCFLVVEGLRKFDDILEQAWRHPLHLVGEELLSLIHVPALRGNPVRTYKTSAVGTEFPGTFEPYVASIVNQWQTTKDVRLKQLGSALEQLGLTWKVEAARIDDTQVELRVGRLRRGTRGGAHDLVSIADVGFGMSQSLPVVVALLAARPGQLVYLEEPEIHLHPRAQVALAQLLADAAKRGVRVVAETHSSLLLLGVQSLVAEGALSPELVALHWFSQTSEGITEVRSADLDAAGAFGDWPEDFDEVTLAAQSRYLDAAEARLARR